MIIGYFDPWGFSLYLDMDVLAVLIAAVLHIYRV